MTDVAVGKYFAAYSNEHQAWYVSTQNGKTTMLKLKCKNEEAAIKLSHGMNNGVRMCKGSKGIGNHCGHCIKCECTVDLL